MCSLTLGLMAAQMGMQMYQNNQQAKAQKAQYEMQARQAEWNRAAAEHKAERDVVAFAQEQHKSNEKRDLAIGAARAQFGSSGLDSTGGSLSDSINAINQAHAEESVIRLDKQRDVSWANYVEQVNYLNEQNAYNTMAKNTGKQLGLTQFGTLLGGASSIYAQGYKENIWGGSKRKGVVA